jgi:uncharacterized protein (TIRG00374 family)
MNKVSQVTAPLFDPAHPLAHSGKKVLIALSVLLAVILYYVARYSKGLEIVRTLLHVAPLSVVAMILVQTGYFVFQGLLFQGIYRSVGFKRQLSYTTLLYVAMNLINTAAPVAGLSGSIYMVHLEHRHGMDRSEGLLINFLYYMVDYVVFLVVLLVALGYIFVSSNISKTVVIAALVFAAYVFFLALSGTLLIARPDICYRVISWLNNLVGDFRKGKYPFNLEQVKAFVEDVRGAWLRSEHSWSYLGRAALAASGLHACSLGVLYLAFTALHVPASVQLMAAGYTVATLLNIVSVTPGGIGFAEGGMTAVFASMGVPVEQSLLVSLLYRTIFTWFPLLVGLPSISVLPGYAKRQADHNA